MRGRAAKTFIVTSTGNHAQRLGLPAIIVIPKGTPFTKFVRTRDYDARIVLKGESVSGAKPSADKIAAEGGLAFVRLYDDPDIVSSHGTIGMEILADLPDLDVIVALIGGGGVIGSIAIAAKALNPRIEIIDVEAQLYLSIFHAIHGLAATSGGEPIAKEIAVKTPGVITKAIVSEYVDDILLVDEFAIDSAVQTMVKTGKLIVEGATQNSYFRPAGRPRPGCSALGEVGGNIVEIYHPRMSYDVPVKRTEINIVVETR